MSKHDIMSMMSSKYCYLLYVPDVLILGLSFMFLCFICCLHKLQLNFGVFWCGMKYDRLEMMLLLMRRWWDLHSAHWAAQCWCIKVWQCLSGIMFHPVWSRNHGEAGISARHTESRWTIAKFLVTLASHINLSLHVKLLLIFFVSFSTQFSVFTWPV